MRQSKEEIEFVQRVYMLMTEIDSISKNIRDILIDEEESAIYSNALMKSELARRTMASFLRDIYYVAHFLEDYVFDEDHFLVQRLEEISKEDINVGSEQRRNPTFYTSELNKLARAVKILGRLLRGIFEHYFLLLGETTIDDPSRKDANSILGILWNRIEDTFSWLDAILNDVSHLISEPPTEGSAKNNGVRTSYLNELRRKRSQSKN